MLFGTNLQDLNTSVIECLFQTDHYGQASMEVYKHE